MKVGDFIKIKTISNDPDLIVKIVGESHNTWTLFNIIYNYQYETTIPKDVTYCSLATPEEIAGAMAKRMLK